MVCVMPVLFSFLWCCVPREAVAVDVGRKRGGAAGEDKESKKRALDSGGTASGKSSRKWNLRKKRTGVLARGAPLVM